MSQDDISVDFNAEGNYTPVWLFDEVCYGWVIKHGAHASFIRYSQGGIEHYEWMDNTNLMARERVDDE